MLLPRLSLLSIALCSLALGHSGIIAAEDDDPELRQDAFTAKIKELGGVFVAAYGPMQGHYSHVLIGPKWKGGNDGLVSLCKLSWLHELTIDSPDIGDDAMQHISRLTVGYLHLRDQRLSPAGLHELRKMPALLVLELNAKNLGDDDLRFVENLRIRWLLIEDGSKITDAGLSHLKPLKDLMYLKIAGAALTGKGFSQLADLDNLRALLLPQTHIDDEGLSYLQGKNLWEIDLSGTRVTGSGLAHLNKFKKLHELNLDATPISDAALQHAAELKTLAVLSLNGTKITDEGLDQLRKLPNLRVLSLRGTSVSAVAVEKLKKTNNLNTVFVDE